MYICIQKQQPIMKTTPHIYDMTAHPEVKVTVTESATSASTYVRYTNTKTGASCVSRYSDHAKHAAPESVNDPDYFQGFHTLTEDEVMYALGLKKMRWVVEREEVVSNLLPAMMSSEVSGDLLSTLTADEARNADDLTAEMGKYIFVRKTKKAWQYMFVKSAKKESVTYYKPEYYN